MRFLLTLLLAVGLACAPARAQTPPCTGSNCKTVAALPASTGNTAADLVWSWSIARSRTEKLTIGQIQALPWTVPLSLDCWATSARPSSPAAGMVGCNATTHLPDYYTGSAWLSLGAGGTPGGSSGQIQFNISGGFAGVTVPNCPSSNDALSWNGSTFGCNTISSSGTPGGSSGQLQFNNASAFGGFTLGGDCTLSEPNITCTKLNGVTPAALTGSLARVYYSTAKCDGSTDDTAAINADDSAVVAAGGGVLQFPAGVCRASAVYNHTGVIWNGQGLGVTVIRGNSGSVSALVQTAAGSGTTNNAESLFAGTPTEGSGSTTGTHDNGFMNMTIDGNNLGIDVVAIYGFAFVLRDVEIIGTGSYVSGGAYSHKCLHTEYGAWAGGAHGTPQASVHHLLVHGCGDGVEYAGPSDTTWDDVQSYEHSAVDFWLTGNGSGKFTNSHAWSDCYNCEAGYTQAVYGWQIDTSLNLLVNDVSEGATNAQIWVRGNSNSIGPVLVFYGQAGPLPYTQVGVALGDVSASLAVQNNKLDVLGYNLLAGLIYFNDDGGFNTVHARGTSSLAGTAGFGGSYMTTAANGNTFDINVYASGGGTITSNANLLCNAGIGCPYNVNYGAANSCGTGFKCVNFATPN